MKLLIIWILTSISFGCIEATLFNEIKGLNERFMAKFNFDIHYLFTVIRGIAVAPLVYYSIHPEIFLLVALLVFPFLHDGMYYQTRNWMSNGKIYQKGWFDKSVSTTAIISLSAFWRIAIFLFGIGMSFVLI